ncbi:MAG: hypothetical protein GXO87_10350 [Chlorobi bacterium]|nr:hypothetical protein [Chlorobiota bacterium]
MIRKVTFPKPIEYKNFLRKSMNPVRFRRDTTGNQVVVYEGEPIDIVLSYDNKIKQLILEDIDLATEEKLLRLTKSLMNEAGDSAVLIDQNGEMELFNSTKLEEYFTVM